jgi:hypothetical protein
MLVPHSIIQVEASQEVLKHSLTGRAQQIFQQYMETGLTKKKSGSMIPVETKNPWELRAMQKVWSSCHFLISNRM